MLGFILCITCLLQFFITLSKGNPQPMYLIASAVFYVGYSINLTRLDSRANTSCSSNIPKKNAKDELIKYIANAEYIDHDDVPSPWITKCRHGIVDDFIFTEIYKSNNGISYVSIAQNLNFKDPYTKYAKIPTSAIDNFEKYKKSNKE